MGFNEVAYSTVFEEIQIRFYGNRGEVMYEFSGEQIWNFIIICGTIKWIFLTKIINVLISGEYITEVGTGYWNVLFI